MLYYNQDREVKGEIKMEEKIVVKYHYGAFKQVVVDCIGKKHPFVVFEDYKQFKAEIAEVVKYLFGDVKYQLVKRY